MKRISMLLTLGILALLASCSGDTAESPMATTADSSVVAVAGLVRDSICPNPSLQKTCTEPNAATEAEALDDAYTFIINQGGTERTLVDVEVVPDGEYYKACIFFYNN